MSNVKSIIAPFYDDDDNQAGTTAIITAAVAASSVPSFIMSNASTSQAAGGQAVIGGILVDRSGSREALSGAITQGLNAFRNKLMKTSQRRVMNLRIAGFNHGYLPWEPLSTPTKPVSFMTLLDGTQKCMPEVKTLRMGGSTALYESSLTMLGEIDLYGRKVQDEEGHDVRRVMVIDSDGFDTDGDISTLLNLQKTIKGYMVGETWTVMFFGQMDDLYLERIARFLSKNFGSMSDADKLELAQQVYTVVASGTKHHPDVARAIESVTRELQGRSTVLHTDGMGIPASMVMVYTSASDDVIDALGLKMSSSFIKASAGKINVNISLAQQAATPPTASADDDEGFV